MRVSIDKKTGELIEMQSDATEGTLLKNAQAMGLDAEEREVTEEEFKELLAAQPVPPRDPTLKELMARLVKVEDKVFGAAVVKP